MNKSFDERYARHFPLKSIGKSGQMKLKNRRVLIAGMGGLGTVSSELLASIGVGYLRIVDYDVVEISNLPRQKLYTDDDIGKAKVEVAEERLKQRNPTIEIDADTSRIDALSAPSLLDGIDLVIDALDRFSTRMALFRVARNLKIPYVFAGAIAEQANMMSFTHNEEKPCLECVVGNVGDDPNQSCEIRGVHPSILSMVASAQVAEGVKILLDQPPALEGVMLYIDMIAMSFDRLQFTKRTDCPLCSRDIETDDLDGGKPGEITKGIRKLGDFGKGLVTSLCGRDTKIIDPNWSIEWEFEKVRSEISKHYHIAVSGKKYITFNVDGVGISLLNSGVATIRGGKTAQRSIDLYVGILELLHESNAIFDSNQE